MDSAFGDAIRNARNSDQVGGLVGQHIINVMNIPVNKLKSMNQSLLFDFFMTFCQRS